MCGTDGWNDSEDGGRKRAGRDGGAKERRGFVQWWPWWTVLRMVMMLTVDGKGWLVDAVDGVGGSGTVSGWLYEQL